MNQPWELYKVNFKLVSPLHIGAGKIGNLELCRTYLPGRTIWGAWTASLTREKYGNTTKSELYDKIGNKLNKDYRISPFYPRYEDSNTNKLYFPWEIGIEVYQYYFMGSRATTALEIAGGAKEGSLREIEFFSPFRRDTGKPVVLSGYIWERVTESDNNYMETLKNIQLGSDGSGGMGRIECTTELYDKTELEHWTGTNWNGSDSGIILSVKTDTRIPVPIVFNANNNQLSGKVELDISRITKDGKRGFCFTEAAFRYQPGAFSKSNIKLTLTKFGIAEQVSASEE